MNNQTPTPRIPAAQMALYGNPQRDTEQQFISLFRKLSEARQNRAIQFLEMLAIGDDAGAERLKRETETELAYLQNRDTRDELESDLLAGHTPEGLQEAIRAGLEGSAGGEA